ncbi:YppG family protein [Priestia megaterium]|uniref:YppG family protein n=1 Tax=Priestia megaterium TaxID=1404 RepID=UPI0026E47E9E|nr:YppG family protein [Priestia megaterium]MDO6851877.1 YppG family protein [Priestia megaterium]
MYRRTRRPTNPFFPHQLQRPNIKQNDQSLLSYFRTSDGNLDFEKIAGTAQQAKGLFNQFSPFITKFLKK